MERKEIIYKTSYTERKKKYNQGKANIMMGNKLLKKKNVGGKVYV